MKQDNQQHQIEQARNPRTAKASTDILVMPEVVQQNQQRLAGKPRRKRRIDYAKKIMNDPFIMNN